MFNKDILFRASKKKADEAPQPEEKKRAAQLAHKLLATQVPPPET